MCNTQDKINQIMAEIVKADKPPKCGYVCYQLTPISPVLTGTAISKLTLVDIDDERCDTEITILDKNNNTILLRNAQILSHNILAKKV